MVKRRPFVWVGSSVQLELFLDLNFWGILSYSQTFRKKLGAFTACGNRSLKNEPINKPRMSRVGASKVKLKTLVVGALKMFSRFGLVFKKCLIPKGRIVEIAPKFHYLIFYFILSRFANNRVRRITSEKGIRGDFAKLMDSRGLRGITNCLTCVFRKKMRQSFFENSECRKRSLCKPSIFDRNRAAFVGR